MVIDSKLCGRDLVNIRIRDIAARPEIRNRAIVVQQKTGCPVEFEIVRDLRANLLASLERRGGLGDESLLSSRVAHARQMSADPAGEHKFAKLAFFD